MVDVVSLLPSRTLRERICAENYEFSERDSLLILYRYARGQEERLRLLEEFADGASALLADIARRLLLWEREKFERFSAPTERFVYELCITDRSADYEECCLCNTYEAAIAAIDAYFTAYSVAKTEPYTFEIRKHPVITPGMPWPKGNPALCRVDADGRVLLVDDASKLPVCPPDKTCVECDCVCLYDEVTYPSFVAAGQLVRYTSDHYPHAKEVYGICTDDFGRAASACVYVYPLASDAVRFCDVREEALMFDHQHIDAPLCEVISPEEIPDERMRAEAAAFWAAYAAR